MDERQPPADADVEDTFGAESTGVDGVDAVVSSLRGLDELPVSGHVAVFERAHESLREVLNATGQPVPVSRD